MNVVGVHSHLVVRVWAVQLPSILGFGKLADKEVLMWQGSVVLNRIFVEHAIIVHNAGHGGRVLFRDHPCSSGELALRWSDASSQEVFFDEFDHRV